MHPTGVAVAPFPFEDSTKTKTDHAESNPNTAGLPQALKAVIGVTKTLGANKPAMDAVLAKLSEGGERKNQTSAAKLLLGVGQSLLSASGQVMVMVCLRVRAWGVGRRVLGVGMRASGSGFEVERILGSGAEYADFCRESAAGW